MRKTFLTSYSLSCPSRPSGLSYSSYVLANDYKEATELLAQRGLGEKIDSVGSFSPSMVRPDILLNRIFDAENFRDRSDAALKLLHSCMFLLQMNRLTLEPKVLFSDVGLLHQLVHCLSMENDYCTIEYQIKQLMPIVESLVVAYPEMFHTDEEKEQLRKLKN